MSIDVLPQTPPPTTIKEKVSSYSSSLLNEESTNKQEVNPHYVNNQLIDVSDNKTQPTAVILKKVIKKPPPLFIDIQQDTQNNTPLKRTIKSPSSSIRLMDLGHLDNDEQLVLEEEIKARRLARRQKTYADDRDEDEQDDTLVAIGTRVAEGHRNYQMMYDMLTGIRIAVGRVSAKIARPLTADDFTAAHKLVFDM
jgi:hypothetical protein